MGRAENKNFTFEVSTRVMNSSSRQFMRFRFGRNLSENIVALFRYRRYTYNKVQE